MSIYITGDTHGEQNRIKEFDHKLNPGDTIIVTGDFGYIYKVDIYEEKFLDDLESREYNILFVDGNHENFDAIYKYPVENWSGGNTHRIRKNIRHLMRGQVFNIDGKTIFTMGGACSIDKIMRREGISWWNQEIPTDSEFKEAIKNLECHKKKVDYVISHTVPEKIAFQLSGNLYNEDYGLLNFLAYIYEKVEFKQWFAGHWHIDKNINSDFRILYSEIIEIK